MTEQAVRSWLRQWARVWKLPALTYKVRVEPSPRMRTSLGRCYPGLGKIRIHAALLDESEDLLREVVCHEAAHVAVHLQHGESVRPHGPEWAGLMIAAGFEPRVKMSPAVLPDGFKRAMRPRVLYEHRCRLCGTKRTARRPVRRWRCRACREIGLEGRLEVSRVPFASP